MTEGSMPQPTVTLRTLAPYERSGWLARMEASFGAGRRAAGVRPEDEPIPSAQQVEPMLAAHDVDAVQIVRSGQAVGGALTSPQRQGRRSLDLFFIDAEGQDAGIGAEAWRQLEARHPTTEVWETETPYFDQRNIHFYLNRCGFHAVEFFHPGHRPATDGANDHPGPERMLRFEKRRTATSAAATPSSRPYCADAGSSKPRTAP